MTCRTNVRGWNTKILAKWEIFQHTINRDIFHHVFFTIMRKLKLKTHKTFDSIIVIVYRSQHFEVLNISDSFCHLFVHVVVGHWIPIEDTILH